METNNAKKKWIALISAVGCVLLALMIAMNLIQIYGDKKKTQSRSAGV